MNMTLTKAELVEGLQKKLHLSKSASKEIIDQIFEAMCLSLEAGIPVKISRFGNFEIKHKKARPGRNPKTGEPKLIKARRVITFKSGQKLKATIQRYRGYTAASSKKS